MASRWGPIVGALSREMNSSKTQCIQRICRNDLTYIPSREMTKQWKVITYSTSREHNTHAVTQPRSGVKVQSTATTKQLAMNLVPQTLLRVFWKCFLWHRWFSYRPWCEFLRHTISQLMHQADDPTQRQNGMKLYYSNIKITLETRKTSKWKSYLSLWACTISNEVSKNDSHFQ